MNSKAGPRICVIGAGAVGSLVAAQLAAAGHAVTVVARGRRLDHIVEHGLRLRNNGTLRQLVVNAASAATAGEHDIVFLALKGRHIPGALQDILAVAAPDSLIVPLVNGIPWWYAEAPIRAVDPEGSLVAAFDPARIVGAVLFLTCSLSEDGSVEERGRSRIVLGPVREGEMGPLAPLGALFDRSGIDVNLAADLRRDLWTKVALNLATNPLSVVADATLEQQFFSDTLSPIVTAILEEAVTLARTLGVEPRLSVAEMLEVGRNAGPFYTSMAQDYRSGLELELGAICQSVFELAAQAGIAMPVARTVHDLCRFKAAQAAIAI